MFLLVYHPKVSSLANDVTLFIRYDYESRHPQAIGDFDGLLTTCDWELKFQSISTQIACVDLSDKRYRQLFNLNSEEFCEKAKKYVEVLRMD